MVGVLSALSGYPNKGSFTYYVISRGGGGVSKCLRLITGGGGGVWSLIT